MRFEEYVTEQGQSLLRLAYVLTGDAQRAEDLTQTALTDAYRHWRRVKASRSPDAYVRKILVNAHLSWHRRRSSTERPAEMSSLEAADQRDPTLRVDDRDELRQLLAALAPRARTVLVLRYYADLDDCTIAGMLGVGPSTVRATASRALSRLRNDALMNVLEERP